MIIEVKETIYKGILVEHVQDQGWKCNLGGQEYLFPNYVAAQSAIDEIYADITPIIKKRKGVKLKNQANDKDKLYSALLKYAQDERAYLMAVMKLLQAQKEALHNKDYEAVEEIVDALIEDLQQEIDE